MHVCMFVDCLYVCFLLYLRIHVRMDAWLYIFMFLCTFKEYNLP